MCPVLDSSVLDQCAGVEGEADAQCIIRKRDAGSTSAVSSFLVPLYTLYSPWAETGDGPKWACLFTGYQLIITSSPSVSSGGNTSSSTLVQKCLQGIDEAFVTITSDVHAIIDDLLPPDDDRLLTPFNLISIASAFRSRMNGKTWGTEFRGVPGGAAAAFVATVVAAAINAICRPIIAPALTSSEKLAVDAVLAGSKLIEKQQQCFGVTSASMP